MQKKKHYYRALGLVVANLTNLYLFPVAIADDTHNYTNAIPTLPNPKLTPGSVRTTNANEICSHGTRELRLYNQNRDASRERYVHVLQSYNMVGKSTKSIQTDHLIPLGIGGADDENNLWPQPKEEAELKDKLEWRMRDLICKEHANVEKLQQEIKTNWWDAYKKYVTQ